jgi:hypothetical protein
MKKCVILFLVAIALQLNYGQSALGKVHLRNSAFYEEAASSNVTKNNTPAKELNTSSLFSEDFSSSTFPPTGWSVDKDATNWKSYAGSLAGGTAPEALFYYYPEFTDTSRLISPSINTTGNSVLLLKFKQYLSWYANSFDIGVATRSNNGPWTIVWKKTVDGDINSEVRSVVINNSDVGKANFQFAFFFQGYTDNINNWNIDDVTLSAAQAHDIGVISIAGANQFTPGSADTIKANVQNYGSNAETFNVTAKVYDYSGATLFTNTQTVSNLAIGGYTDVAFTPYTLSASNSLYKIEVTASATGDTSVGNNTISKNINTYTTSKNLVVVEVGTGTWCQYCPGAQLAGEDFTTKGQNVGIVEYHYSDTYQNRAGLYRISYYGISGFPTAFFDGTQSFVGGSNATSVYSYWLPIYTAQSAIKTPLNVTLTGTKSTTNANQYTVNVNVQKLAQFTNTKTKVYVALTESSIPFTWQGQTKVDFAERLLLPDSLGYKVDLSNQTSVNVPLTFTRDTSWVTANLELVAWVQDDSTKEIFNGAKLKVSAIGGTTPVELTSFSGAAATNGVKLTWATATETNNKGFEIQKSTDGKTYSEVGFVVGSGTSAHVKSYSFTDANSNKSGVVYYRLKQIDYDGTSVLSNAIQVNAGVPLAFALNQNYPNPFNPTTKISYSVPTTGLVTLKVYNITGEEVATLVNEVKAPGNYNIDFNASKLASGVYFYKMTSNNFMQVKKLSLLK